MREDRRAKSKDSRARKIKNRQAPSRPRNAAEEDPAPNSAGEIGGDYDDRQEGDMAESVYKVVELVGTSTESWERAATAAVEKAEETLRDLRVAEVVEQDLQIEEGKVIAYRAKLKVSFKYERGDQD